MKHVLFPIVAAMLLQPAVAAYAAEPIAPRVMARIGTPRAPDPAGTQPSRPRAIALSADGKYLAVGGIGVFLLPEGRRVREFPVGMIPALVNRRSASDDYLLIAYGGEKSIVVHDLLADRVLRKLDASVPNRALQGINSMQMSADGSRLVVGLSGPSFDTRYPSCAALRAWDLPDGKAVAVLDDLNATAAEKGGGNLMGLALSPDGKLAAFSLQDSAGVCLLELATGKSIGVLRTKPFADCMVWFSADGKRLYTQSRKLEERFPLADPEINVRRVWDVASQKLLRELPVQGAERCLPVPGGRCVAVEIDGAVRFRDIETDKEITDWRIDLPGRNNSLATSQDGRVFVVSHQDGTVEVLDVSSLAGR